MFKSEVCMKISLETAKLAIGQMQLDKMPKRERLLRRITPMVQRNGDTKYVRELLLNGVDSTKPIFYKLG